MGLNGKPYSCQMAWLETCLAQHLSVTMTDGCRESELNDRLEHVQLGEVKKFSAYGDAEFVLQSRIKRRHGVTGVKDLPTRLKEEDHGMHKVRIGAEWDYATTANLYPWVHFQKNHQLLRGGNVALRYFVASLLKNCHVCLYGSQSASYFNCPPPSLESFMRV
eukprot:Lithocolla_globosa_v1_NODE_1330_length_2665_cov_3.816545.p2 type:complete len:163 gc:universal NODE_1330_length_2665_cov_3.816545:1711-1223(-)